MKQEKKRVELAEALRQETARSPRKKEDKLEVEVINGEKVVQLNVRIEEGLKKRLELVRVKEGKKSLQMLLKESVIDLLNKYGE